MSRILAILQFGPIDWTLVERLVGLGLRLEMQLNLQGVLLPRLDCVRIDIASWSLPRSLREDLRLESKFKTLLHVNKFN